MERSFSTLRVDLGGGVVNLGAAVEELRVVFFQEGVDLIKTDVSVTADSKLLFVWLLTDDVKAPNFVVIMTDV